MRTIQVVNVRWYNATAWYGVTLAKALGDAGHPSLVIGLADTPPLERARELGLETVALPLNNPLRLPALWPDLNRLLRNFRPDVVNCHRGESFFLWALLKRRHHFALIRTRGDQRPPKKGVVNRWLHGQAADALVATNSENARRFHELLGVPSARIHTILGGVDTARFAPDESARRRVRAHCGFTDQDFVLGLVGRMDEVKGIRETIMALGRTVGQWGHVRPRLLVIGFASQYSEEDVAHWSAEAGLEPGQTIVTGRVDRPEEYINALDLGVLASLGSEAIARAALEIMASRVPLVSSRVGVMPDLLPPDSLFELGDVAAMAAMFLRGKPGEGDAWRLALQTFCFNRIVDPAAIWGETGKGLRLADFRDQTLNLYCAAQSRTADRIS